MSTKKPAPKTVPAPPVPPAAPSRRSSPAFANAAAPAKPAPARNVNHAVRREALTLAIDAQRAPGNSKLAADAIIAAARKFEAYLVGE